MAAVDGRDSPAGARVIRVCVTGPESTGKTTLAKRLAEHFSGPWAAEGARVYAERKDGELTKRDVSPIAREAMTLDEAAMLAARQSNAPLVVLDTDLVSTMIYSQHYYGSVPAWIEEEEKRRRSHLYLLCDVDHPWSPDRVRDAEQDRSAMFARFKRELERRRLPYVEVRGDEGARWALARGAVERTLRRDRRDT